MSTQDTSLRWSQEASVGVMMALQATPFANLVACEEISHHTLAERILEGDRLFTFDGQIDAYRATSV